MLTALALLVALILLIAANGLFVAVEFSFLTVNRTQVRAQEAAGDHRAAVLEASLMKTSTNLSGAQLGITVSSLVVGFLTGPSLGALLNEVLGITGMPRGAATGIATTAAFVIATLSQMVFGELAPKNWAIAAPMRVARLVVHPQRIFMLLFGWLVKILNDAANWVLRLLGFTPSEEVSDARSASELRALVSRSSAEGTLDAGTAELLIRSIEFGDLVAADVMKPRPQVVFLADHTVAELLAMAVETGHSRFPVEGESVDDLLGAAHFKHALTVPADRRGTTSVRDIAVEAPVVVESMPLDPLLRELRGTELEMAIVVDEYGGTAGVVTLEDLLEEILGEIDDEQDEDTERYEPITDREISVSGLLRPDELGDIMDLDLPEGQESETLGGLIAERLEGLPEPEEQILVEALDHTHRDEDDLPTTVGVTLRVASMGGNRVERITVRRSDDRAIIGDPPQVPGDTEEGELR